MVRCMRTCLLTSVVFAGAAAAPVLAYGQAQPTASPAVSEIVVTAEKRNERLLDVPVAVTVIKGADLLLVHATTLEDWAGFVPGLAVSDNGAPGREIPVIDGVPPLGAASEVGVYVNDTPIGSSSSFQGSNGFAADLLPYDLNQVEVLHGPQGTLYGASTMGGLIKYVLAQPDLDKISGAIGGDILGVAHGDEPGGGGRGEINLPLIKDVLAVRASGYDEITPGYIDDSTTGQKDDNQLHRAGGRVALLWKPSADFTAQFGAIYQFTHADNLSEVALDTTTGQPISGPLSNINSLPEPYTQELQLYDLTLNWDLRWATLTSISSYQTFTNDTTQDLTQYIGIYLGYFGAAGPGEADFHEDYRLKKFTQEIRLASPQGQKLEWLVGGYYTHETGSNYEVFNTYSATDMPLAGLNPLEFVRLPSAYDEYAIFGDATYHFTDWFDLAAGLRYAHNRQSFTEYEGGVLVGSSPVTAPALTVPGRSSEGVVTFAVSPELHLSKSTLLYARIASGYQPGGPNVVLPGVTGLPLTFSSSRLVDYQVGVKSTFLDGHATIDVSAFDIDWSKIQVGVLIGNESAIENAGAARSQGFDFAGTWTPVHGLTFGSSLAYSDAIFTSPVPSLGTVYGARLPYVPMWSGSLSINETHQLSDLWTGFVGGGWRYTGSRYSAAQGSTANGHPHGLEAPAYGAIDMHLGGRTHDLTLTLFARNLTDRRAYLAPISQFYSALQTPIEAYGPVLQPRTIGLSIDKTF